MNNSKLSITSFIRIFTLILVLGLFIALFFCYTELSTILEVLNEFIRENGENVTLSSIALDFQNALGWYTFLILFTIVVVILSIKVILDLYYENRQGHFANEINKIISQIDQDSNLSSIKVSCSKLVEFISAFSNSKYGSTKKVYNSLEQVYTIKSMRAEEDFEKLRAYTSILLRACVESLSLQQVYNERKISRVADASVLYDIGKLCVPGYILYKDGNLNANDFEIAKYHAEAGYEITNAIKSSSVMGSYESYIRDIASYHHEKFDGSGYPFGKAGEEIPFVARVFAIVSTYDTITRDRPYRKAMSHEEAVLLINNEKGKSFDPNIVKLFNAVESQFKRIKDKKSF